MLCESTVVVKNILNIFFAISLLCTYYRPSNLWDEAQVAVMHLEIGIY